MPLTRSFKDTVVRRLERDPAFKEALLSEAAQALLAGDVDAGKALLRDYVHGTIGFQALGSATGASPKSLMRMLGPKGNPQAKNLFAVLHEVQARTGIRLEVRGQQARDWEVEELRRSWREGIESGPAEDGPAVFARLRQA